MDQRLNVREGRRTIPWFEFWDLLVGYRNAISHADSPKYGWLEFDDFYEVMTPLLEAAVVEAFTDDHIADVIRSYPVGTLGVIEKADQGYAHRFTAEYLGRKTRPDQIILDRPLTELWQTSGWEAVVGSQFVLTHVETERFEVRALFFDFLARGLPEPLAGRAEDDSSVYEQTDSRHPPKPSRDETAVVTQGAEEFAAKPVDHTVARERDVLVVDTRGRGAPADDRDHGSQKPRFLARRSSWAAGMALLLGLAAATFLVGGEEPTNCRAATPRHPIDPYFPRSGCPHGTGVSIREYPRGIGGSGGSTATFNNYVDVPVGGLRQDERRFVGARVVAPIANPPVSPMYGGTLPVRPGDTVLVSMLIDNNARPRNGDVSAAPSVAQDTRAALLLPDHASAALKISGYLYGANAKPDYTDAQLHTILSSVTLRSETGQPLSVSVVPGSARFLQYHPAIRAADVAAYRSWPLAVGQTRWLMDARTSGENLDPHAGLPVGHDARFQRDTAVGIQQDDELRWFGGLDHLGYVQVRLKIAGPQRLARHRLPTVTLDMDSAGTIVTGSAATGHFANALRVQQGNVVEVSDVLASTENARSEKSAVDTKLRVILPKAAATTLGLYSEVVAANNHPAEPYHSSDTLVLRSANGSAFTVGNIRGVRVAHNAVPVFPDRPRFHWRGNKPVPNRYVDLVEFSDSYQLTITIPPDGKIGAGYARGVRLSLLVDVSQ